MNANPELRTRIVIKSRTIFLGLSIALLVILILYSYIHNGFSLIPKYGLITIKSYPADFDLEVSDLDDLVGVFDDVLPFPE